jgi:hypothetical protein
MASNENKNARLDVKALSRANGLNFDGIVLTSAGVAVLADSAAAEQLTDAAAAGRPVVHHAEIARSPAADSGSQTSPSSGPGTTAPAFDGRPASLVPSEHAFSAVSGSGTSQALINTFLADEVADPVSPEAARTTATSPEEFANRDAIATDTGVATPDVVGQPVGPVTPAPLGSIATVDLTASTVDEGGSADYVFTATLSSASHGVTTIHTDQGDISIADGATTGTLVIASGNGEDVYTDASSLTASITGVSGGGFEHLVVGSGTATAAVTDTATDVTVDLTASTVDEGSSADYVFTATLSSASHGVTTIHTDQGDIRIAEGATTGTLVIASGNEPESYDDATRVTLGVPRV